MLRLLLLYTFCALVLGSSSVHETSKEECEDKLDISSICAPIIRARCLCGCVPYDIPYKGWKFIVNCTDTGFTNTSVLQQLPQPTEVLIFSGNSIEELPWNVFGTLNSLSKLRVVDLSNNGLREIRGKSLHRVANVELLILNHNSLTISRGTGQLSHHHPRIFSSFFNLEALHLTNAFIDDTAEDLATDLHDIFVNSNLTKLKKLHLEQNEITGFKDSRIFCDLPNLMDLHLGDNKLTRLDFDIECLPHLRFLDLERNNISVLNSRDIKVLDNFPARNLFLEIDLNGNPFSCDCKIGEMFAWLQKTNVTVRKKEVYQCDHGIPESNKGEYVIQLRQIQCQEASAVLSITKHRSIPILIGFLVSLLVILLALLLYMNRMQIKKQLTPILDTVSRKVQYTSIGKQEDQEMDV